MHFIPLHPESASDLIPPRGIGGCCAGAAFPAGTLHFHPLLHLPAGMVPGFPSSQAKDRDHSIPGRSLLLLEPSGEGPEGQAQRLARSGACPGDCRVSRDIRGARGGQGSIAHPVSLRVGNKAPGLLLSPQRWPRPF